VIEGRRQGAGIVARISGIDDRDAAHRSIGRKIHIPTSDLPQLEEGEYFWDQLKGLEAVNLNNDRLGVVDRLFETGANDVIVITGDHGEVLVPFVPDVVREVDLENGLMRLDWDEEG
jgi:16S rRNA processing protein RimM